MDDELFPPSAFINRSVMKFNLKSPNQDDSFALFTNDNHSLRMNGSCQTEWVKMENKASSTIEPIFTESDFHQRLKTKKDKYMNKISTMKQRFHEEVSHVNDQSIDLSKRLHEVVKEKDAVNEELSKLKFYISGMENRDAWLEDKRRLIAEIDSLNFNVSDRQSIIDSLKRQLYSMEKIQSIQERELDQEITINCSNNPEKGKHHFESLLRAWRHKVLSLLVQQESADMVAKDEKHHFEQENRSLQNEIEHLRNNLEQGDLRLEVHRAQLSTSEILIEKYRRENDGLYHQLQTLDRDQMENNDQMEIIFKQLSHFQRFVEQEFLIKFDNASSKIDSFDRRLEYASSRFPVIKANVHRYRNMGQDTLGEDLGDEKYYNEMCSKKVHQLEEALITSNKEMKMLRQERDRLIATMEEDSATFHDRLDRKKEELREDMEHLREAVSRYDISLPKMSKDLELLKQENNRLKVDYDMLLSSKHTDIDNLNISLKESRVELSKLSCEFSEYKRSTIQGKKYLEEQILTCEERLKQCDNHWKKVCDQLSSERDILKMTIRQEGLFSKFKVVPQDKKCSADKSFKTQGSEMESIMKEVNLLAEELSIDHDKCD